MSAGRATAGGAGVAPRGAWRAAARGRRAARRARAAAGGARDDPLWTLAHVLEGERAPATAPARRAAI